VQWIAGSDEPSRHVEAANGDSPNCLHAWQNDNEAVHTPTHPTASPQSPPRSPPVRIFSRAVRELRVVLKHVQPRCISDRRVVSEGRRWRRRRARGLVSAASGNGLSGKLQKRNVQW
jgi:hypothetical protein